MKARQSVAVDGGVAAHGGASPLDALASRLQVDLDAVNHLIVDHMQSEVALIPQLAAYIVASGGKRIRPLLTLATARLCGHEGDRAIGLAAAVEFIHTATLLHDDVVDESELRRGKASANAVFGNQASVLVGDFLFARAFQLMVADRSLDTLRILSNASAVIVEGEVLQLSSANDVGIDESVYMRVIEAKTAALFAAACEVGAVVAGADASIQKRLKEYGNGLGLAFQMIDDVLDYSANQARLGKTVGDDFREGKVTYPVILAYRDGTETERAFWRRCMEERHQEAGDLAEAQRLLASHRAIARTVAVARVIGQEAKAALEGLAPSPIRSELADLVDFAIDRHF